MFYTFDIVQKNMKGLVGGKAFELSQLYQQSFPVPEGGVLTIEGFDSAVGKSQLLRQDIHQLRNSKMDDELCLQLASNVKESVERIPLADELMDSLEMYIQYLLARGYPSVAVRSSSVLEDMEGSSFAGLYESVLGINNREQLQSAIKKVWASAFTPQVIQYCLERNIKLTHLKPAVIIQGLIDADTSGVLFTVNPVTGNDKTMVIDACQGLAEALVQGKVTPKHYQYNWFTKEHILKAEDACLNSDQIESLCATALAIQKYYGSPQDIEWAYKNEQLFILQSRPIAAVNIQSTLQWTNADFKDGGVAAVIPSPLMWSLYERVMEHTMPLFLKSVGLLPKTQDKIQWTQIFFGFPYWNLTAVKSGVKKIPGFNERQFDNDLGIHGTYEGDGYVTGYNLKSIISGLTILFKINRSIAGRLNRAKNTLTLINDELTLLESFDHKNTDDETLYIWVKKLVQNDHAWIEREYFNTIYDNSNAATLFKDILKQYNKKQSGHQRLKELRLISGLGTISHLRHVNDLWKISRELRLDPSEVEAFLGISIDDLVKSYLHKEPYPFSELLNNYIHKYKHHSNRELDLLIPCWDEDPRPVYENLKRFLVQGDSEDPNVNTLKQEREFDLEQSKILSKSLLKELKKHRAMLVLREEMRNHSTRMYRLVRMSFLNIGKRLCEHKKIQNPQDIFYLSVGDALDFFIKPNDAVLYEKLNKNKDYYQSFRAFKKPNEISPATKACANNVNEKLLNKGRVPPTLKRKGTACSAGVVEAKVWVQQGCEIPNEIEKGIILVARYTDPSYTLLFSSIAGLITETGGMLSHGAVVSREYGIPAVLAIPNACTLLRTGMRVRLDGDLGEFTIIDEQDA